MDFSTDNATAKADFLFEEKEQKKNQKPIIDDLVKSFPSRFCEQKSGTLVQSELNLRY